jgi:hypothetical protein
VNFHQKFYGIFQLKDEYYLCLEYMNRGSLDSFLRQNKTTLTHPELVYM